LAFIRITIVRVENRLVVIEEVERSRLRAESDCCGEEANETCKVHFVRSKNTSIGA
jgi:hypothetical protein